MTAHYTLVVGTKNWSSWSLRPYLALRAAGVPFEEHVISLRQADTTAQIHKHSGSGRVPVLKIAENGKTTTVWDSLAICETLAERHPEAHLWPKDASIRAEARSYSAEMHSGFADVREQLSMDFARKVRHAPLREETRKQIARILGLWEHALSHHSDERSFLFGGFSIADCMYGPVVSRFHTYGIEVPKVVRGYMDRVMALPAMRDWGHASQKEVEAGVA